MPVRCGLDTLPRLLDIDPAVAVVICSSSLNQRRVLTALRMGAIGFIVTPFDRDSVLAEIHHAASRATPTASRIDISRLSGPTALSSPADEQREFIRIDATLPIRVSAVGERPVITTTVDLSGSGALLSAGPFTVDTQVEFRLELGAGAPPIHGRACVARVDADGRPALAFKQVSIDDHQRLIAHLHAHATTP
jgi:hypothetical protein